MVHKQLLATLAKHGVEPIAALGQPFDPNLHEALIQQPDADQPEGTVVAELSKGYRIRDRVLRPTKVAVSVQPAAVDLTAVDADEPRPSTTPEVESMPTYDYICDACSHEFEAFESIKADPQTVCPDVPRDQAPPQDRRRGRDPLQGVGLLPDRLPERVVQEGRRGRQAGRARPSRPTSDVVHAVDARRRAEGRVRRSPRANGTAS